MERFKKDYKISTISTLAAQNKKKEKRDAINGRSLTHNTIDMTRIDVVLLLYYDRPHSEMNGYDLFLTLVLYDSVLCDIGTDLYIYLFEIV